ncbi:hypothetical protein B0T25DRAFT_528644 [Lasiosphaeria hispida]|uniref:NAD-dependent epimerase/dehydratase domain-containing protein n=1 Tax=Lasiosphaeria hispida TaxID=260671 RepID=A0AAJ0MKJ2_9PEZI|nr:hypothetical protein B0T25DRAFT_528644 [Lasiosphaeria hispida]
MRLLADHLRVSNPRSVYASSQAVFGQPLPAGPLTDDFTPTPQQGMYGTYKLTNKIYLNELHRRGFLEVFIVRLPTISVRPGKPTVAASSLSGIIREPMYGLECIVPFRDREFKSFLTSPRTIAENLVTAEYGE